MEDFSQLHRDLLELIAERLDSVCDRSRFGAVCTTWRSVVVDIGFHQLPQNQFPGLMVPEFSKDSETRRFLQLNYKTGLFEELTFDSKKLSLLVPHRHICHGSAYGWVFVTDDDLNTKLLNPFTGAEIKLPSATTLPPYSECFSDLKKWRIFKAIISSNPSHQPQPTVLIIHGGHMPRLAFSEPGDDAWTCLKSPDYEHCYYLDAVYCNEQFYALSHPGYIIGYDIRRTSHGTDGGFYNVKMTRIAPSPKFKLGFKSTDPMYLVELEGKLVTLSRHVLYDSDVEDNNTDYYDDIISGSDDDDDNDDNFFGRWENIPNHQVIPCTCNHDNNHNNADNDNDEGDAAADDDDDNEEPDLRQRTVRFKILRFEPSRKRWVNVESLGDNSFFIGYNTSFSLRASDYPAGCVVPNSVYFTEDNEYRLKMKSGGDVGIYNVTDKSIEPLYETGSQFTNPFPLWVTHFPQC